MQRVADAVYVIKKIAEHAAPGAAAREGGIRDEIEAARNVSLQMEKQSVIARTIIRFEDGNVGNNRALVIYVVGNQRRKKRKAPLILVGPEAVISLFVDVVGADHPLGVEGVLDAAGNVQSVGSLVSGCDNGACSSN